MIESKAVSLLIVKYHRYQIDLPDVGKLAQFVAEIVDPEAKSAPKSFFERRVRLAIARGRRGRSPAPRHRHRATARSAD
jgi:hypothetical protein